MREERVLSLIFSIVGVLFAILMPVNENGELPVTLVACPYRTITGNPCPFCGSTRSFVLTGHLRIREALEMNPIGLIFFFGLLLNILYQIFMLRKSNAKHTPNVRAGHDQITGFKKNGTVVV